ncbi:MAG: hypothetical protein WCG91_01220 [Candidatus Shapirobacteria bacterium]
MLPKPEKIKKTPSAEQLDLVDTLSLEKKVKNKRRFVLIALILTTGLSFAFWTYRSSTNLISNKSFPKIKTDFKIPEVKMSDVKVSSTNFDQSINQIISKDSNHWSIKTETLLGDLSSYSLNPQDFSTSSKNTIDSLSKLPVSTESLIKNSLPQGTKIQELGTDYLITTPQQKILFQFKINGQNIDQSKKLIPSLVEKLYWYLVLKG